MQSLGAVTTATAIHTCALKLLNSSTGANRFQGDRKYTVGLLIFKHHASMTILQTFGGIRVNITNTGVHRMHYNDSENPRGHVIPSSSDNIPSLPTLRMADLMQPSPNHETHHSQQPPLNKLCIRPPVYWVHGVQHPQPCCCWCSLQQSATRCQ